LLQEYNASSGHSTDLSTHKTETEAVKAARGYLNENEVEYNLTFDYF